MCRWDDGKIAYPSPTLFISQSCVICVHPVNRRAGLFIYQLRSWLADVSSQYNKKRGHRGIKTSVAQWMDGLVDGWLNNIAPTMIPCTWIYRVKDPTSFSQCRQKYWPYLTFTSTACCKFMDNIINKIYSSICIGSYVAQFGNSCLPSSFHVKHSPNGHSQGSH